MVMYGLPKMNENKLNLGMMNDLSKKLLPMYNTWLLVCKSALSQAKLASESSSLLFFFLSLSKWVKFPFRN